MLFWLVEASIQRQLKEPALGHICYSRLDLEPARGGLDLGVNSTGGLFVQAGLLCVIPCENNKYQRFEFHTEIKGNKKIAPIFHLLTYEYISLPFLLKVIFFA